MFNRFNDRVEELQEPRARSLDRRSSYQVRSAGVESHGAPRREMDNYWDLFAEVSLVREAVRAFAGEVTSDGYYIDSENEELREQLEDWLEECCIVNCEVGVDLRKLVEEVIVQLEVRGTAFVEIVENDQGGIYGFKSLPADSIKQYTLPGQGVLLAPDQDIQDSDTIDEEDIVRNDEGDVAAYVQYDESLGYERREPVAFTRDEVIKLTRDGDVGSPWGESRLKTVKDRVESLLQKLDNNDKAIESLAWKFWLFKFGTEENPWPEDKIDSFMSNHRAEDFEPGEKHGVQGNIDIETVSGEVADIEDYLGFDIDWIIAGLPYVKYGLGGFEENVNQFVSRSQEARIKNQVQEVRRTVASGLDSAIKDKAQELGYSREDVELVLGLSPEQRLMRMQTTVGDMPYQPAGGSMIDPEMGGGDSLPGGADFSRPPASTESPSGPEPTRPGTSGSETSVWDAEGTVAELADTSVEGEREELAEVGTDTLLSVRDEVLDSIERTFRDSLSGGSSGKAYHPREYRKPADRAVRAAITKSAVDRRSESPFMDSLQATYSSLEEEGVVQPEFTGRNQNITVARRFSDDYSYSIRDAAEEMARDITHTVQNGLERGEQFDTVRQRVTREFNEANIRQTARLISQMELKNAVETTRLREYELSDDVIGVRPTSNDDVSTPLCRHLTGRDGEQAVAYFEDGPIGEQLQDQVSDDLLLRGFDPLPSAPPFHYGCSLDLEPVLADEAELAEE